MTNTRHAVRLYLPMRRYRLRLFHCVLSELGAISHALLRGMGAYGFDSAYSADILGLDEAQLSPVRRRLKALDILNDADALTERGHHLARQLVASHQREIPVWLGMRTNGPVWLLVDEASSEALNDRAESDGVEWADRAFPSTDGRAGNLQRVRLRKHIASVMKACFEEAAHSVAAHMSDARDWDLRVDADTNDRAVRFLAIDIPLAQLKPGKGQAVTLACTTTTLVARHDLPEGTPAKVRLSCPAPMHWALDHATHTLNAGATPDETGAPHLPRTALAWPSPDEAERARAAEMLLSTAANDLAAAPHAATRTMSFEHGHVLRGLSWQALSQASGELRGVHCLELRR